MNYINDFLLNLFTMEPNKFRPALSFPCERNGIVYATDAYVIIAIPENSLCGKYGSDERFPNAEKYFERYIPELEHIPVKVSDLSRELIKARIQVDRKELECKDCCGDGSVEWEYESNKGQYYTKTEECPVCNGEGCREIKHPFARIRLSMIEDSRVDYLLGIEVGDLYFHPFQLYRLFMVAFAKHKEEIDLYYDEQGYVFCNIDDIRIVVMQYKKPEK